MTITKSIRLIFYILLFLIPLHKGTSTYAQEFNFANREFSQIRFAQQIKTHGLNDTLVVMHDKWDEMIASPSTAAANYKFKMVNAFVKFKVNHQYHRKVMTPYTIRMVYTVYGYNSMTSPTSYTAFNDTLTISYNPDSLSRYQDHQIKKYPGFHKIMVVVKQFWKINDLGTSPELINITAPEFNLLNFNVEGTVMIQPYHKRVLNGSSMISVYPVSTNLKVISETPNSNYLPIRWNFPYNPSTSPIQMTPANYELEWTYVDNYKVDDVANAPLVTEKPITSLQYDFSNNSTKIITDTNFFKIPLVYQSGYIVYRVRIVRPDSIHYSKKIYGPWSINNTGNLSAIPSNNYRKINTYLNDSLNWQYTISYAEQGKYKQVLSFFDGLLKNRQSITRFNSLPKKLIATEQVYDYEGRPAISILPVPVSDSAFKYVKNLSLNSATNLNYKASDFDGIAAAECPQEPLLSPLSINSPANKYYSQHNPDTFGIQRYVPNAGGYPFVHTKLSPGFDDRILKQGGAGDSLQLYYGHITKNNYLGADQSDLNRMFGLNVGHAGFYRKTVSRDPNGQLSLNYTDYEGRNMASSLIGIPDTSLHALTPNQNVPDTSTFFEDLIVGATQTHIDNKIILEKNVFNDAAGNNSFQYKFKFFPFPTFCPNKFLTIEADYKLSLYDECGNEIIDTTSTVGSNGIMASGAGIDFESPAYSVFMEQGEHGVYKSLAFDYDKIEQVVDGFLNLPTIENCTKDVHYFIKKAVLSKTFPCGDADTSECLDLLEDLLHELHPNFNNEDPSKTYGYYNRYDNILVANSNSIFSWRYTSGPAMSTVYGSGPVDVTATNVRYRYQDSCLDAFPASVTYMGTTYTNIKSLPVDTFIMIFNDAIAKALLPLHPKYCELLECAKDPYEEKLTALKEDYLVAEQLNLMTLHQVVTSDPIYTIMTSDPTFVNPLDSLKYFQTPHLRVDSMPLVNAYCFTSDNANYYDCTNNIYKDNIQSFSLINNYVKERYYKNMIPSYLLNRSRFKHLLPSVFSDFEPCDACNSDSTNTNTTLIFTDSVIIDTINKIIPLPLGAAPAFTGPLGSIEMDPALAEIVGESPVDIEDMLSVEEGDDAAITSFGDLAEMYYDSTSYYVSMGAINGIITELFNCGDSATVNNIRLYLNQLVINGVVTFGKFRYEHIRAAILSASASINDFCNPWLVNYNHLFENMQVPGSQFICYNDDYYSGFTHLMQHTGVTAINHLGTPYTYTIDPTNASFNNMLQDRLGTASNYQVYAQYNTSLLLFSIVIKQSSAATDSLIIRIKNQSIAGMTSPFELATASSLTTTSLCIADPEHGGSILAADGLIKVHNFLMNVKRTSGGVVNNYLMNAWVDSVPMMKLVESDAIQLCVPCTKIKDIYADFLDTLVQYNIKGIDHPNYSRMLDHYVNMRLRKVYDVNDIQSFISSCAIADSTLLPLYTSYAQATFPSMSAYETFITAFNTALPGISLTPYMIANEGGGYKALIDFNTLPYTSYRLAKNFLQSYTGSGVSIAVNNRYLDAPTTIGKLVILGTSSFTPTESVLLPGLTGINFGIPTATSIKFSSGEMNTFQVIDVIRTLTTTLSTISQSIYRISRYLYEQGIPAYFIPAYQTHANEEYFLEEKKKYLEYVYQMQGISSSITLDSLKTPKLRTHIPIFHPYQLSYGHIASPNDYQHLFLEDTSLIKVNTKYDKMKNIINDAKNYFLSTTGKASLFFTGANTRFILPGHKLDAFRCQDGSFYYRYFDNGDTLMNIWFKPPLYFSVSELAGFEVMSVSPKVGNKDSRMFSVKMNNALYPGYVLEVEGQADFTVGKNKVLHDVLLAHSFSDPVLYPDTVNNCEKSRLNNAIYQGKINYQVYRDSIKTKLMQDFEVHCLASVQEHLYLGYKTQRFNYTLYNYDRAGNLSATIPPAGVQFLSSGVLSSVNTARNAGSFTPTLVPNHLKKSVYQYNTLNQAVYQHTPDAGETRFFYDAAGRVIFSQNEAQKATGDMTYTLYDEQGRIYETGKAKIACPYFPPVPVSSGGLVSGTCYHTDASMGVFTPYPPYVFNLKHYTHRQIRNFIKSLPRQEVVHTVYDVPAVALGSFSGMSAQENLRKRVSAIKYATTVSANDTTINNYKYAMHYSYDMAGNVKSFVRDFPELNSIAQRFKRMDYDYDLISGKVNMLSYNRGYPDQYYQKYIYDGDNRITKVMTSQDGYIWTNDATYEYYTHGPLARVSIGDLRVQGVDYIYTLQGWLKAVNGDILNPNKDIGGDGKPLTTTASDAVALTLQYFKGDYRPITATNPLELSTTNKNMYNGNIPGATTAILPFPDLSTTYSYDQLNRLIKAEYANINRADAAITNTAAYYSSYAYDPDGNIKKLVRNANNPAQWTMDSMIYKYQAGAAYNNKLLNVNDYTPDTYDNDIKFNTNTAVNRYTYDPIGNLTKDLVSGIDTIQWNMYGKVASLNKDADSLSLYFDYDGAGNRYMKTSLRKKDGINYYNSEYYVRDAQGNILATYDYNRKYKATKKPIAVMPYYLTTTFGTGPYLSLIASAYAPHPAFKSVIIGGISATAPAFLTDFVAARPLSFFTDRSEQMTAEVLARLEDNDSVYHALADYTEIVTDTLIRNGLTQHFLEDKSGTNVLNWYNALFDTRYKTTPASLQRLHSTAPTLLSNAMSGYNMVYESDPDANMKVINEFFDKNPELIANFLSTIVANGVSTSDSTEFKNVLAQIFIPTYQPTTGEGVYSSLLRNSFSLAHDALNAVTARTVNISPKHFTESVDTIVSLLNTTQKRFKYIKTYYKMGQELMYRDEYDAFLGMWLRSEPVPTVSYSVLAAALRPLIPTVMSLAELEQFVAYRPDSTVATSARLDTVAMRMVSEAKYKDIFLSELHNRIQSIPLYELGRIAMRTVDSTTIIADILHSENYTNASRILLSSISKYNSPLALGSLLDHRPENKSILQSRYDAATLVSSAYDYHPDTVIAAYSTAGGVSIADITSPALAAIPGLTPDALYTTIIGYLPSFSMDDYTVYLLGGMDIRHFSLSSHHLYGSSRLGVKDYMPQQHYISYSDSGGSVVRDTLSLLERKSWYELERDIDNAPNATVADYASRYATHTIGMKQYELTNHLGNVQATISDLKYPVLKSDGNDGATDILSYRPALHTAYDYYPFGMLMPGRYVDDTTTHCMNIIQTKWVDKIIEVGCYWVYTLGPTIVLGGGATFSPYSTGAMMSIPDLASTVSWTEAVTAGEEHTLTLEASDISGSGMVHISELVAGQEVILKSLPLTAQSTLTSLTFVPSASTVKVSIGSYHPPFKWILKKICKWKKIKVEESYIVKVCDEVGDKYRFGYEGHEKDNEIAGIGNHYTALYGEADSRIGRRWNQDPKPNPSISNYALYQNNPIMFSDVLLDSVAFILDKEGASGNGHMAMLFQDEGGKWNYFSVGAAKQDAGMVGTGTKARTTFQPMVKKTDAGVVNMTLQEAFAVTKKGIDGNAYDEMAVFNTNKKEDGIISKNVSALKERFDKGTDLYQLWQNNCADACQDAIEGIPSKGGIKTGIKTPSDESTPRPNSYFPEIKKAAKRFNYPIINVAPPSGLDNFPSKPIYQQVDRNTNQPVLNTPAK